MNTKLKTRDLCYCSIFSVFIFICTNISIAYTVPFTMQTFAVYLTLLTLGGKLGLYSISTYLLMGAVGVPVFSGFSGGIGVLLGSTGGYLLGFLVIGFVYYLIVKNPLEKIHFDVFTLILGTILCYFLGTVQFITVYSRNISEIGFFAALSACVFPFVLPDAVKLYLAFLMAKKFRKRLSLEN